MTGRYRATKCSIAVAGDLAIAACSTDDGGGYIVWVVVDPNIKKGFTSTSCYQH